MAPGFFKKAWDKIKSFGSAIGRGISKAVSWVKDNAGNIANGIGNIAKVAGNIAGAATGIGGNIGSTIGNIAGKVGDIASKAGTGINAVRNALGT